jgi:hypothetical protein
MRRRRPNEGAAAAADETRSLVAAHSEAQAQAFGEIENARLMGLELQQVKADVARLQAEVKLKDEASQSKDSLLQAIIRPKDEQISLMLVSKDAIIEAKEQLLQAKDAEIRRLNAALAQCGAGCAANGACRRPVPPAAAPAPAPAPAPALAPPPPPPSPSPSPALGRVAASGPGYLSKVHPRGSSIGPR